jgi:drug/metabolite transporter (DMT)-like permease
MAAPTPAARGSHAMPLLVAALATLSFVCMDAVIKVMAVRYDALQLSFFRFAGASVFALSLWSWQRSRLPQRAAWRMHIVRSLFLLVSLVGYFHALTLLPLAQTVAISYLAPIFVSVLGVPSLKEGLQGRSGSPWRSAWPAS